jgi:hypothetical protein
MTPAARLSAAIEVIADIEARRRPAADALKDWGLTHRFAGSSDRAGIAGLVYDALRRKSSSAWLMSDASPRAVLLGMLHRERGLGVPEIAALCSGARFAPAPLTDAEQAALAGDALAGAPAPVLGDYPDWLDPNFARVFGDERAAEGAALASRAPLDLRVNTLKSERDGRRQEPGDPRRASVSERCGRNPGRRLAARRAPGWRAAGRAGGRSRGRGRRKDAGPFSGDGKSRTDLRNRHRQKAIGADP